MSQTKQKKATLQSKALEIVVPQYRMHTQLFDEMLANVGPTDALKRIGDVTNHFVWMVGNIVNTRYWLANILSIDDRDPNDHLFKDAKSLDTKVNYPSLNDLKLQWHRISPQLYHRFFQLTDGDLAASYNMGMGISFVEENKLNMIGMALDRESYLLGQMGLMRRALGFEGVKYDFTEDIEY